MQKRRNRAAPVEAEPLLPFHLGDHSPHEGSSLERPLTASSAAAPPVFARHPRARRYVIRVDERGNVRVTMPRWGSRREAEAFVRQERAWIERERRRREEERQRADLFPWFGAQTESAMRARAGIELPARLLELAALHGLRVARVSVRNQKWRWGSCSPSGHVCLNWHLVQLPDFVRDYVLVHELMHLRRMDHSKTFWRLVAAAYPDYQEARAYLRAVRLPRSS